MSIPRQTADAFLTELQKEAFANAHELLGEVPAAAQRLWTSALKMMSVPAGVHVCMSFLCLALIRGQGDRLT
jgi:hypothetical protein